MRNLKPVQLSFCPELNVIHGNNGQGKTSLLEAVAMVATSRSFRTEMVRDVIQHGQTHAVVAATVQQDSAAREQRVILSQRQRKVSIDGQVISPLSRFAIATPIVVFHPPDLQLVSGPAAIRRTLLARVALYSDPLSADDRMAAMRALRERQVLLETEGTNSPALSAYEQIAAERGSRWANANQHAAAILCRWTQRTFERIAPSGLALEMTYRAAGSCSQEEFALELCAHRTADSRVHRPTYGPQRDELSLLLAGRQARRHASQGQQRLLALALKLGELESIREARGLNPVLLLDDVSSELDAERSDAVEEILRGAAGQIFLTTARHELLRPALLEGRSFSRFEVCGGVIEPH